MTRKTESDSKLTQLDVRVGRLFLLLLQQVRVTCQEHHVWAQSENAAAFFGFAMSSGGGDAPRGSASTLLRLCWDDTGSLVLAGLFLARLSATLSSQETDGDSDWLFLYWTGYCIIPPTATHYRKQNQIQPKENKDI